MLYINDQKQPHYKYDDVVDAVIKSSIDPKRAYIYLASIGVKGTLGRIINDNGMGYSPPVKLAIKDNKLVNQLSICKHCKKLIIE